MRNSFACLVFAAAVGSLFPSSTSAQNLFEADRGTGIIYEFTTNGARSTFATGFDTPQALAVDSASNLFMADSTSGVIYKFTPNGTGSTFTGGLNSPSGLAFNSAGNLFEADYGSGNIYEFTPGGIKGTFATGLNEPLGLAFDAAGNLFEADYGSGNIYKFTPSGAKTTFASGLGRPFGLAFNRAGILFEADNASGRIIEFTTNGAESPFASGLSSPTGLAFDGLGNLFEADASSGTIYEFTPSGAKSTFAGGLAIPVELAFQSQRVTPAFSGLTASQSIPYGTSAITLAGTLSAPGPIYPPQGETITVTIDGNAQTTTISNSTGGFSLSYNPSIIPVGGPYTVTYSYGGDYWLLALGSNLLAATAASTTLTVTKAAPSFSNLTASQSVPFGASAVTLAGKVSAPGLVYPAQGETITVTINGNPQTTTIDDATGDFSFNYNPSGIPSSTTPYAITYSYAGDASLISAVNTSTALTVNLIQNLFEADLGSQHIYEFTTNGTQITFASSLHNPQGLAFNSAEDLFEGDATSGDINEFTMNGTQSTFASGYGKTRGLAFNSAGILFVADNTGNDILEFTTSGVESVFASGLNETGGLAFNSAGDLFEADEGSGNIYEFTPGGIKSTFASGLSEPAGLAFDSAGDLFEADEGSGNIYEFTNGVATEKGTFATGLNEPTGLAFDVAGILYVANQGTSYDIYEFTTAGVKTVFASGLDEPTYLAFQPFTPAFSGLTASQSIPYETSAVTLSGTVSAPGPVYPAQGEKITVTINGNAQTTTIDDSTGDFSFTYNPSTFSIGGPYTVTYAYGGDNWLLALGPDLAAVTDTSTTLTVTKATPSFTNLTASQSVTAGTFAITLGGTVNAPGPVYPAQGETITVSINGNAQMTTIKDATGDFSFSYNPSTIPASAPPYTITYSYAGDSLLISAVDTSTTLTVNPLNYYWDPGYAQSGTGSGGNGIWNASKVDWFPGDALDTSWSSTAPIANFGGTSGGTVTLLANVNAYGLNFIMPGYFLTGFNTLTLTGNEVVIPPYTTTIGCILSGSDGLALTGSGTLVLSGANTYTGATILSAGILQVDSADTPGTRGPLGASGSIVMSGGTLQFSSANQTDYSGRFSTAANQAYNIDVNGQNVTFATGLTSIGGALTLSSSTPGGMLTLSGVNTYTGNTTINSGALTLSGSGKGIPNGLLLVGGATGKGVVNVSGEWVFTSAYHDLNVGGNSGSNDTGVGAINQTGGDLEFSSSDTNYLALGAGGSNAYGAYNLSGGVLEANVSVGEGGIGSYLQTGGVLGSAQFGIGGSESPGTGVATFTGGGAITVIVLSHFANATAVMNLGTEVGGTASITNYGGVILYGSNNTLNLNSGTLTVTEAIGQYSPTNGAIVNLNGGTVQPLANYVIALIAANTSLDVYNGGVTFDTLTNTCIVAGNLLGTSGNGIYPSGGILSIASGGGSGYIGPPLVTVSGGSGSRATAIANVTGGVVTGVTMTCPGQNYIVGQSVSFAFSGGGPTTPAATFNHVLTSADIAANSTGGLVKTGTGTLTLSGVNTYTGPTTISAGTLVLNGDSITNTSEISIAAGAILSPSSSLTLTGSSPQQTLACMSTSGTAEIYETGTVLMNAGALLSFQAAGGSNSTVGNIHAVNGSLDLNNNAVTINVTGPALAVGDYLLMSGVTGSAGPTPTITGTALSSGYTASISTDDGLASHCDLIVNATPVFSGLSSPSIAYATGSVILTGILSSTGGSTAVYPAIGDTVSATINGHTVNGTVNNSSGGFSITYNDPSLATDGVRSSPYTVTYAYAGNSAAFLNAAADTSTTLTVNPLPVVLTGKRGYDGTATAAYGILSVSNKIGSDVVAPTSGGATLAGAGVGTQPVTSPGTLALGGAAAVNYTLTGAGGAVTISNSFKPFTITSASLDISGTNFVLCWQSVPGVVYSVLTNTSLKPQTWVAAGSPITATGTTTCVTLPGGIVGTTNTFVVIKQ